jgi:general stress protein 26
MASLTDTLVKQLLEGRYIAALATQNPDSSIHVVAVWYWFDGAHAFVATSARSRKVRNLQSKQTVSLMIDARDPAAIRGVNLVGVARVLTGDAAKKPITEIHRKYLSEAALADPRVGPVFAAMDDAAIEIKPVSVITWDGRDTDRQFFGGAMQSNPTYRLPLQR